MNHLSRATTVMTVLVIVGIVLLIDRGIRHGPDAAPDYSPTRVFGGGDLGVPVLQPSPIAGLFNHRLNGAK